MNRTVPWSIDAGADGPRAAGSGRRTGAPSRDRRDDAVAGGSPDPGGPADHAAGMEAIAAQLERLSASLSRSPGEDGPPRGEAARLDALRDAVAAISRRQADLDRHGDDLPAPAGPAHDDPASVSRPSPGRSGAAPAGEPATPSRASETDLSAEVSRAFARFSRDLRDAIHATDVRPDVEALGRDVREIGRAVDGLGSSLPGADALARIGEETREMRGLLEASTARTVPFDGVERQVASLEARLGRLASPPGGAPPGSGEAPAGARDLHDGLDPSAAVREDQIGAIADRLDRGLDGRGPSDLIESLSRRVDEVHASLRAQLAASAVDTRPLEGLVRGLSDRIGQARQASDDFHQLEATVRDAAARIDGAAAGLDARGVGSVEAQLARLGERLDRSEASLRTLDGVEHALGELFSQFEVTRQVAIDAAETAARTAARDTLRAALQNPNLGHRSSDAASAAVDQMARSLDDMRALQDTAERRTQSALSDIHIAVDRLAQQVAGSGLQGRAPERPEEARRPRAAAEAAAAGAPRGAPDAHDHLIEPGFGRASAAQAPRPELDAERAPDLFAPIPAVETDGPASFIAAARRAAQIAQASASTTVTRAAERGAAASRARPGRADAMDGAALGRAKLFLSQRRRPMLLGLAALVLLVGAFEVVKLSANPAEATRVSESGAQAGGPAVAAPPPDAVAGVRAELPAAVLPPAAAPAPPPLPAFVAGPAKATPTADGIGEGLRAAAGGGDPGAQLEIGLRYAEGHGVPRDPKQAVAWFEKAAAGGSVPAAYRLGSAYEKGVGVDRDAALAVSWYGKAADAGNIRAMHNLAVMSAEGAAGKPDYAKAAQWFGKASSYGVRDSQFNLAILYARGLGIEQSLSQCYTWFAIAAAEGDEDAGKKRDEVAAKLDAKALSSAKAAADAFHAAVPPAAANDAVPPPGGWDAPAPRASGTGSAGNAKVSQL